MASFSMNMGVPAPPRDADLLGYDNVTQYSNNVSDAVPVKHDFPTPLVGASVETSNTVRVQIGSSAHDLGGLK